LAVKYRINHRTIYRYGEAVSLSLNQCCLRPRNFHMQKCDAYELAVKPAPPALIGRDDFFGNHHDVFNIGEPHREMIIDSISEVEVLPRSWSNPEAEASAPWEDARDALSGARPGAKFLEAMPFVFTSPMIRRSQVFAAYAAPSFIPGRPLLSALLDFTRRMKNEFTFDTTVTTIATKSEDILEKKRGVCQDISQLQAACLRSLGLATR
jgi:transglutaminase-like putative cysteine protease